MDDADARGHHGEGFEGLLAPLEELVALAVADELDRHVAVERELGAGEIDLHRVVHHEVDGNQRLDLLRSGAALHGGIAHRGDIDQQRHAGEVLEDDSGNGEGDFVLAGILRVVVREVLHIGLGHLAAVDAAQHGLQHDADGNRQFGEIREALFGEGGEGVELAFGSGAGGESAECVHEKCLYSSPRKYPVACRILVHLAHRTADERAVQAMALTSPLSSSFLEWKAFW